MLSLGIISQRWVVCTLPKYKINNILLKFLSLFAFSSIVGALLIISTTPGALGYELSIYNIYPWYFWIFLSCSLVCGILILMLGIYNKQTFKLWPIGFLIVIFTDIIILSLPFFRNYFLYPSDDALTHIGLMKDIMITGHISKNNFYPSVHLLGVFLTETTSLKYGIVINLLFISWTVMFLLNMYFFSKEVAEKKEQAVLILAFCSPLLFSYFHTLIHPSILSILMLPLLLAFYHKTINNRLDNKNKVAYSLLLVLLAISITYVHPITCLFAAIIIFIFDPSLILYKKLINNTSINSKANWDMPKSYRVSLIIIAVFILWYFSYSNFLNNINATYTSLVSTSELSPFQDRVSLLNQAGISTMEIINIFINRYAVIFLYILISIISLLNIIIWLINDREKIDLLMFEYSVQFIMASLISALFLFNYIIEQDIVRISRFVLLIAPMVCGLVVYKSFDYNNVSKFNIFKIVNLKGRNIIILTTTLIIIIMALLSLFNVYMSPRTVQANMQVSEMDANGVKWISLYKYTNIATVTNLDLRSFEDMLYGRESYNSSERFVFERPIPSHFGFSENSSKSDFILDREGYILTREFDREVLKIYPENARKNANQYLPIDFLKLKLNHNIIQLYSNGEFEMWLC